MPNPDIRPSYQKIDYSIRPAKAIERKMLCESFQRLSVFDKVENYQYVGFGSTFFCDFSLFHKSLKITKMVSIEKEVSDAERFKYNRPYNCINLQFGHSNEVMPTLNWNIPTILWLDYDGKISPPMLSDVGIFCSNALPGSIIVITINAHAERNRNVNYRLRKFRNLIGENKIPPGVTGQNLNFMEFPKVCRRVIANEILEVLTNRNGALEDQDQYEYLQLYNFEYQDGAKMLTVGGIIYQRDQRDIVDSCKFENIHFIKNNDEAFVIDIPKLTLREIKLLDSQLPFGTQTNDIENIIIDAPFLPEDDVVNYKKIYRYFPNFAETEL